MTQLESARRGDLTPEMHRVAQREGVAPGTIRAEVARGRLVIPANTRHLAGSGGAPPLPRNGHDRTHPDLAVGHPGAPDGARLWVNQTVAQRQSAVDDPSALRGERAPRRLDP